MNLLKRKEALAKIGSHCGSMSSETRIFIQKICYKKSASIDMTQYGFIRDSKVRPINLMMKPLQEQLERICGKNSLVINNRKLAHKRRNEKGGSTIKSHKVASRAGKSPKHAVKKTINRNSHILDLIKSNVTAKKSLN